MVSEIEETERLIECPVCKRSFKRDDMLFSFDCRGIPYRLICYECNSDIIEQIGYDGEYYTELDEQIEPDY